MHRPICIPSTPPGITFFSIAVATHLLSGNSTKEQTLLHLFGRPYVRIASCFSASVCIAQARGTLPNDVRLLKQTGALGLYTSAMPSSRAELWLKALQRRGPQHFATGVGQSLLKSAMHCCPQCMQEDQQRFGVAYWHTVHQMPGVLHCPLHHIALRGACLHCGCSQGSEHVWRLPAPICFSCGSDRFESADREMSQGYVRHLSLVAQAVLGDYELLRPKVRVRLYAEAFRPDGNGDIGWIVDALLNMWRCSNLAELSSALGTHFTSKFVELAIRGDDVDVNPLGHLALISLAQSLLEARASHFDLLNCPLDANFWRRPLAGLEAALDLYGLPRAFAEQLAAGHSLTKIGDGSGVSHQRLRRQLEQVFAHSIDELHLACADDVEFAKVRGNLQALAEKLRGWRRRNYFFPRQNRAAGFEDLRRSNRSKVLFYIEQGVRTRDQLHTKNTGLGNWCRKHDADWFNEVMPVIPPALRKIGRRSKTAGQHQASPLRLGADTVIA